MPVAVAVPLTAINRLPNYLLNRSVLSSVSLILFIIFYLFLLLNFAIPLLIPIVKFLPFKNV